MAGPILKAHQFYPQIAHKSPQRTDWSGAFKILILGYFLKIVIADNLKDQTFWIAYPYFEAYSALGLCGLLFGYSAQIFADFAGYSLIAIGVAKLFGYDLPTNFNFPYISQSFSEFWRRWHISLSSWLKDYLYIPLGGNRKGALRTYVNLLIVMTLGGFWHGAAWNYIVWGIYHGILLALERYILGAFGRRKARDSADSTLPKGVIGRVALSALRICVIFSLVSLGWLLFNLSLSHALCYIERIVSPQGGKTPFAILLTIALYALPVGIYHINHLISRGKNRLDNALIYGILLFLIITNGGSSNAFIYFQF